MAQDLSPRDTLWKTAQQMMREQGMDFASHLANKGEKNIELLDGFFRGHLDPQDQDAVCALMETLPALSDPHSPSDQWETQARQFFTGIQTIVKARLAQRPSVGSAPLGQSSGTVEQDGYVKAFESALPNEQGRAAKFFRLALTDPTNIEKSFRVHVTTDKPQWHNSLTFKAKTSSNPYWAALQLVAADLLQAEAFESLLSSEGIKHQVLVSARNWIGGKHADKAAFREDLVAAIGEMAEEPVARAAVEETLARIGSEAVLPPAVSPEKRDALVLQVQAQLNAFVHQEHQKFDEYDLEDLPESRLGHVLLDAMANPATNQWLPPSTWLVLAQRFPEQSQEHELGIDVLNRLKAHLLCKVDPTVAFPPPEPAPAASPPRRPKP